MDVITQSWVANPEEMLINKEALSLIEGKISKVLSSLEKQVLYYYLEGKSYQEISDDLGRHVKSIDNALQRVKRKLNNLIEKE